MKHLLLALIISAGAASAVHAFRAQNDMEVVPLGPSGFQVAYRGGRSGAPDFWCAAGDYVVRELGRPGNTRIYRTTSTPRRAGKGLEFSLLPENAKKTGLVSLFGRDKFVTAAVARHFCNVTRDR